MTDLALTAELASENIPLNCIYLDPNNPRFAEFEAVYVPDTDIEAAQDRIMELLIQKFDIAKLQMSIEVNGFLPIDRIIVRKFAERKFVVLEGNRRVAAGKSLLGAERELTPEVMRSLENIPCLLYTGTNRDAAWIFQGLRHITGIYEWPAFQKAKLLVDQMEEQGLTLTQVGQRFGLTPHGAGQWVRGYRAFKQARERSDYINEVSEESYPYFQELFSQSSGAVREWMGWNEQDREFKNELNFNEFVGWLYPRKEDITQGDWEERRIARRDDIRTIAYLMRNDNDAFNQFRTGMELERAYSLAQTRKYELEAQRNSDPVAKVFDAIDQCAKACEDIPWKAMRDDETRSRLFDAFDRLVAIINNLRQ